MFKNFILALTIATATGVAQSEETCASMGVVGANYSNAAFQLTVDDVNPIDSMGFFDAYLMYLSLLFEKSQVEGKHSKEFLLATKVAGVSMKKEKEKLVKTLSLEGYKEMFPRMVVRSCEIIRANPH